MLDYGQPRRVPRAMDKLILHDPTGQSAWRDTGENPSWLRQLRRLAGESGCVVVFDGRKDWRSSYYEKARQNRKPTIFAGGAGDEKKVCTAALHELGHHILFAQHRSPRDKLKQEEAAWQLAAQLATQNRLPFVTAARKEGMHSHRQGSLQRATVGSKRQQKRRPQPKTFKLASSKRTVVAARDGYPWSYPLGSRGRRHAKKLLKRATSKGERRRPVSDE